LSHGNQALNHCRPCYDNRTIEPLAVADHLANADIPEWIPGRG